MNTFEYTVIPAPTRTDKAKGGKSQSDRYAAALTDELNRMANDGWDYVRADVLPSEERSGLTGRTTVYHNLLVFRRAVPAAAEPVIVPPVVPATPKPAPEAPTAPAVAPAKPAEKAAAPEEKPSEVKAD